MENKQKVIRVMYIGSAPDVLSNLEGSGKFKVVQKDNSIAALNFIKKYGEIEAIVSEVHLPGSNGIDTFRLLKKHEIVDEIPFVLVAHEDEPEFFNEAFKNCLDDYFMVPLDLDRLYKRLVFLIDYKKNKPTPLENTQPIKPYKTPFIKRLFDVIVSGTALILLSPLMLLVIIAIKLESKGSFYYVSPRVGANFRVFGFYKFRSMFVGSDSINRLKELKHLNQYAADEVDEECKECAKLPEGEYCSPILYIKGERICENLYIKRKNAEKAFMKLENDPRVTKVGKFIRNTSIDELPQLVNILKGDMSVVGNRPLPVNEAEKLTLGDRAKRFHAAAGLTGLWQVELRGRDGVMSEEERFNLDNQYAENNSFWGDMKLIFRTFKVFIQRGDV